MNPNKFDAEKRQAELDGLVNVNGLKPPQVRDFVAKLRQVIRISETRQRTIPWNEYRHLSDALTHMGWAEIDHEMHWLAVRFRGAKSALDSQGQFTYGNIAECGYGIAA